MALPPLQKKRMNQELSCKTAICVEYFTCHKAMQLWRSCRLQSAYLRIEHHNDICARCRFVSKIGGRDHVLVH
jgi:hypothetical protein